MIRVRVYALAKELKTDTRKILDEANRLGVNIHVPSNWVSEEIANIICAKYQRKNLSREQSKSVKTISVSKVKSVQGHGRSKYRVSKNIKVPANQTSTSSHKPLQSNRKTEIILESKRAKRIEGNGNCSKCGALIKILWQYSQSNVGVVYLCSRCKPIVYGKSFGSADALNMAYQGGLFERNRRKH